ncbi:MAG: cobalamin-dependent protein [Candidatus Thiodiazotropha sp.]
MSQSKSLKLTPLDGFGRFLDALIQGDEAECALITNCALENDTSITNLYQGLFQPALYRVGELWATNRISVATEHMATAITEGLMNRIYPHLITHNHHGRKVVIATVEGELHQVGAKMAADVFEMHGWDSLYLGSGQSTATLLSVLGKTQPDMVGLSFSVFYHMDSLKNMLAQIRETYPDLPILVGGQGVDLGGNEIEEAFSNVTSISNLDLLSGVILNVDE